MPAADQLLPATTKGFVSFPDVAEFRSRWQTTQLGQLAADPVMKPFAEDLQRQLHERFVENNFNVSLTWRIWPAFAVVSCASPRFSQATTKSCMLRCWLLTSQGIRLKPNRS